MARKVYKLFARLFVGTRWDPAIVEAGNDFELMWYRALQWGREHPETRGFIPKAAIANDIGRGIRSATRVMNRGCIARTMHDGCTKALLVQTDSGWQICRWDAWQETPEEIERAQERKRTGAQITNHKLGRHKETPVEGCPMCTKKGRSANAPATRSSDRYSDRSTDADIEEEGISYGNTRTSRTDGPRGAAAGRTSWPRYADDWKRDDFRPTDYLLDQAHLEEGGWDGGAWIQPSVWRDGWSAKGMRPAREGDAA